MSRLQFKETHELPINDYLRDDTLLKIIDSDPWYANIMNFIVTGYVPPSENKRKLIHESCFHLKIQGSLSGDAIDVKNKGTSTREM